LTREPGGRASFTLPPADSMAAAAARLAPVTSTLRLAVISPFRSTRTPSRRWVTTPAALSAASVTVLEASSLLPSTAAWSWSRPTSA
jgi:hypothetical protein